LQRLWFLSQIHQGRCGDAVHGSDGGAATGRLAGGHELIKSGKLRRLFRIVGRRANFSIWDADSFEELHENLLSLPMHPWMEITVTSLIEHPSETEFKDLYGNIPPLN
jgi:muconolactone delta-isomerase